MAESRDGWSKFEIGAGAVGALGSVLIPVALFLVGSRLEERQRLASERQIEADRVERMLVHLASDKKDEKKLAVRVLEHFVRERQFPAELMQPLVEIANSEKDEEVSNTASQVLAQMASSPQPTLAEAARAGLASLRPRLNVHAPVRSAADHAQTQGALDTLSHEHVVVSPQQQTAAAPESTELRYYRKEDETEARAMAERLSKRGVPAEIKDWSEAVDRAQTLRPRSFDLVLKK